MSVYYNYILKKLLRYSMFVLVISLLFNCTPSRFVKPLAKNQNAIGANLGGPLIHLGKVTTPVPFTSLMFGRGITNKTTAFGSLHLTSLLFGNIQTDIGVCQQIYKNDSLKFGLTITPAVNMVYDTWQKKFRAWPQLDVNAYKDILKQRAFIYVGLTNWFELSRVKAHNEPINNNIFINPHVGITRTTKKWNYTIETKFLQMNKKNTPNVVEYVGIKGNGAIAIYLNLVRKF